MSGSLQSNEYNPTTELTSRGVNSAETTPAEHSAHTSIGRLSLIGSGSGIPDPFTSWQPAETAGSLVSREQWQAQVDDRMQPHMDEKGVMKPYDATEITDEIILYDMVSEMMGSESQLDEDFLTELEGALEVASADTQTRYPVDIEQLNRDDPLFRQVLLDAFNHPRLKGVLSSGYLKTNQEVLRDTLDRLSPMLCAKVQDAIAQGYLPAYALNRYQQSFGGAPIRLFDNSLGTSISGLYAPFHGIEQTLINSDILQNTEKNLQRWSAEHIVTHELTHRNSGGTFINNGTEYNRRRTGFGDMVRHIDRESGEETVKLSKGGLNEAVTEHLSLALLNGGFETIDPDKRQGEKSGYYSYRKVLADFIEKSGGHITIKTILHAYFEDGGPSGSTVARRAMMRELVDTYGYGSLKKLELISVELNKSFGPEHSQRVLGRIHPPSFAPDGTIVQKGYIDTTGLEAQN